MSNMARALCAAAAMANGASALSPQQAAARKLPLQMLCDMANAVLDKETGEMLEYRQLLRSPKYNAPWSLSAANEFGRLAQGVGGRVNGTNTIFFISHSEVPKDRKGDATYGRFVCNERPQKEEVNRTRLTVGGNRINYPGEVATPTADLLLVKVMFNSVISTENAKFMTMDIKNFYLNTPLPRFEYVKLKMTDIPTEIVEEYNLKEKVTPDGSVYVEIRRGMYGLPQAGLLAQELLEERLKKHGYSQSKLVHGLWTHKWRPIQFTLVVDDFGVKYVGKEHAEHLLGVLKEHYEVDTDWEGKKYVGITLDWDYERREVHLSMPGYVGKALTQFGHEKPARRQDAPAPYNPPNYGAKQQFADGPDSSPPLSKEGKKFIQRVNGKFLFLGRAIDSTLLVALSTLASQQATPTEQTKARAKWLLDYVASQEEAVVTFRASKMILAVHSDASYLCESGARSRAGGHFFMTNDSKNMDNNGAVLTVAQIIKAVMSSAAEAELGALYINAREAVHIRTILEELGHPQPPTPVQTDNATAEGVVNGKVIPKRTKAMDMRFHWLRDRSVSQGQFSFFWRPGPTNRGDYHTKQHAPSHHRNVRPEYLTPMSVVRAFRERLAKAKANSGNQSNGEVSARVC
jgi:hypothetical protein